MCLRAFQNQILNIHFKDFIFDYIKVMNLIRIDKYKVQFRKLLCHFIQIFIQNAKKFKLLISKV